MNAQTPGLPAASEGQVITKEVTFYEKVGEFMDTSPELCQFYFVQKFKTRNANLANLISDGTILHVELILTFDTGNPEESLQSVATILNT